MNQNNRKYAIQGHRLIIGESLIPFNFTIAQVIEVEGMLIVRLEPSPKDTYNENVFGVSILEKKIKWQIEKKEYKPNLASCPFVEIRILENQLILHNWCDTYFVVEPKTGEILEEGYSK